MVRVLSSPLDGGLNSRAPKGDGGLNSRACLRILSMAALSLSVEYLKVLMVEYLKVLGVEYLSSPLGSST